MEISQVTTVSLVLNEHEVRLLRDLLIELKDHADTELGIDWERFRTVLLDRLPIFGSA